MKCSSYCCSTIANTTPATAILAVISGEVGAVRVALETADAAAAEYEDEIRTQVFAHPGSEVWELLDNLGVNVEPA